MLFELAGLPPLSERGFTAFADPDDVLVPLLDTMRALARGGAGEALAEALVGFLGDPPRRARVGEENRRTVLEHHELHRQSAGMAAAFREAAGE